MPLIKKQVHDYAAKHTRFFDKLRRKSMFEIAWRGFKIELQASLENIYGIRNDPKNKSPYDQITYKAEG